MGKKDEYCTTMESEIKKWDAEVDKLNARGNQMSADVRVAYDTQIRAMRADRDLAYSKLHELHTANESAWQHMQSGVDAAWISMKNALDKAASQFK
jgi:outer membrane murein-binding lipoprotein Lpp